MSNALELQKALALKIRLPENELDYDLFQLNSSAKSIMKKLAADPLVSKYGKHMNRSRKGQVFRHFDLSKYMMPSAFLERQWTECFVPSATKVRGVDITYEFLQYLLNDSSARNELESLSPPFIFDLIKYEQAELIFRQSRSPLKETLPKGSQLKHRQFLLLNFNYDIPQLLSQRRMIESGEPLHRLKVEKKRSPYLLLGVPGSFEFRLFEIPEKIELYLKKQLAEGAENEPLPEEYSSLVEIGLCKTN